MQLHDPQACSFNLPNDYGIHIHHASVPHIYQRPANHRVYTEKIHSDPGPDKTVVGPIPKKMPATRSASTQCDYGSSSSSAATLGVSPSLSQQVLMQLYPVVVR